MPKSKLKNRIAIVLDRSGSMSSIRTETMNAFNAIVKTVAEKSRDQETTVSYFTFANRAVMEFFNAQADTLKPLTAYHPDGMTAMLDGIGLAVTTLQTLKDDEDTSYLVIVVTDGLENQSTRFNATQIAKLLKDTQATDRWSFVFQVPPGNGAALARDFKIPSDNIREWETTSQGMVETQVATVSGLGGYFAARARGQKKVTKFFQTDLSKLDSQEVRKNLDDISNQFKQFEVAKEASVKDFVELKTRKPYVIGSAYYQLMKTEKIQPQKSILIMEKGKKAVWGGRDARHLIGLPDGDTVKCEPGNHSNFDIFIQSTSVNRKLPRGTKVLVDTTQTKDLAPTWDHTAGAAK